MALTYSEQILLLAWDEQAGTLRALPELAMRYALAGALLLELALAGRIDMDLERLHLVDAQPTGDPLLDDILRRMGTTGDDRQATADWLNALAWQTPNLSDADHPSGCTCRPSVVVRGWPGLIQMMNPELSPQVCALSAALARVGWR
jgi:hypothetical protein